TSKWDHFVKWKRNTENDKARLDAKALLDGMLAKERLLDLVENFTLFDDSRPGGTRKIVARNHQVLGVNSAVASVQRQRRPEARIPPGAKIDLLHDSGIRSSRTGRRRDQRHSCCRRSSPRSCAGQTCSPGPWPSRRFLAHAREWEVLFNGVLCREGPPCRAGQLHVSGDDGPRGPGRPDLAHIHRLWRFRPED